MNTLQLLLMSKKHSHIRAKKTKIAIFSLVILGILCLLLFRSCSTGNGQNPVYKIARDGSWPDLQILEKGINIQAFTNDLAFAIAKNTNTQIELLLVTSERLFPGLEHGQYDGVLSSFLPTAGTRDWYQVSNPIYLTGPVLIVPMASSVKSLSDMNGKIIGILSGTSTVFNVEQYPNILITSYDSALQALSQLDKNVIDAVILPTIPAYMYTSGLYAGRLKIATLPLTAQGIRVITLHNARGNELIELFNRGLNELKADGTYKELLMKWNLYNPEQI